MSDEMTLPPFSPSAVCPKCGATKIVIRWHEAHPSYERRSEPCRRHPVEHLLRRCDRCYFEWVEAVLAEASMSLEGVAERVEVIRACAGDAEGAHGMEDRLYEDVLRAIVTDDLVDAVAIARLALGTKDVEFPRWTS